MAFPRSTPSDIAFADTAKAIQSKKGSRNTYVRMESAGGWETRLTGDVAAFIAEQTSFVLAENPKVPLFLIDFEHRQRVKIWGTARVIDDDPELLAALMPSDYDARPERVVRIDVAASDANCPQHIPQRSDAADVAEAVASLKARVAILEAELASVHDPRRPS